jgi:ufm1-conjugating enzyme 1
MDNKTKETVQKIPLLKTNAGPRDGDLWNQRLKEEFAALIKVSIFFPKSFIFKDFSAK